MCNKKYESSLRVRRKKLSNCFMIILKLHLWYRSIHGEGLKILISEQMLQTLSILLVQVKGGNRSENLQSKIRQVMYSLYKAKEIAKKVCNNIMTSIKL